MVHGTFRQSRSQPTRKQAGGNQQLSGSDFVTLHPELNLCTASSPGEQGDVPHHPQPILKMGNSRWTLIPHPTKDDRTAVCTPTLPHWLGELGVSHRAEGLCICAAHLPAEDSRTHSADLPPGCLPEQLSGLITSSLKGVLSG